MSTPAKIEEVTVFVNGTEVKVPAETTLVDVCSKVDIKVPTLCHHPRLRPAGSCRVCTVGVEDGEDIRFVCACSTKVKKDMRIRTDLPAVKVKSAAALRHMLDRQHKPLQQVGAADEIESLLCGAENAMVDDSSYSVNSDFSKCVTCNRCVRACTDFQGMNILAANAEPEGLPIIFQDGKKLAETECISCGQCTAFCPTGAMSLRNDVQALLDVMKAGEKVVVLQTAPSVRVTIAEPFGHAPGTIAEGKLVAAAKAVGFNYVFDTDLAADLTIVEEATELVGRVVNKGVLPMFTSCCPGWINMVEKCYPEMAAHVSSCRSPMSMFSPLIKEYWAKKIGVPAEKIYCVALMPCTAKKDECKRSQLTRDGHPDTDLVLTTREMAELIKMKNVNFDSLNDLPYDDPLGESTGAAIIFGATGGVMEAALRTGYEYITKKPLEKLDIVPCRGPEVLKEIAVDCGGLTLKAAVVHGGANCRKMIERVKRGEADYHFIEFMACPGGCIGGGGQPLSLDPEVIQKRMKGIYDMDLSHTIRRSHENPSIKKLYDEFLGHPNGHVSHELLHTHYTDRRVIPLDAAKKEEAAGSEAPTTGPKVVILYASQGGNTAKAALDVASRAKNAEVNVVCKSMKDFDPTKLAAESTVLFMTCTFGDGELPDAAKPFFAGLQKLAPGSLSNMRYSVCGFGSSNYKAFCAAAIAFDTQLAALGAKCFGKLVMCDEAAVDKGKNAFEKWNEECIAAVSGVEAAQDEVPPPRFVASLALPAGSGNIYCPPGSHWVHLKSQKLITPPDYPRPAMEIEIDIEGSGLKYNLGDHIGIMARNSPAEVDKVLAALHLDGNVHLTVAPFAHEADVVCPLPARLSVRELFEQYIDLHCPPSTKVLKYLALFAQDAQEKAKLLNLAAPESEAAFKDFAKENDIADTICAFPSVVAPLENLMSFLPLMSPRLYSIASAPKMHAKTIQLIVVLVQWQLPSKQLRNGLCTDFLFYNLNTTNNTRFAAFVKKGILAPPTDPTLPCVMVGLGTGIAAMRSFLQHRQYLLSTGVRLGPALLYFGCRHRAKDFFCQEEIAEWVRTGVLTDAIIAFSHDQKQFITPIQKMEENPAQLSELLKHPNCHYYYCGPSMGIPEKFQEALTSSLVSGSKMTREQAETVMATMKEEGRYRIEAF